MSFSHKIYWEILFTNFGRDNEDWRNSCLNYGYAIIRGAIARGIVGAGLLPCLGVHHSSGLNAFNLADDILEPFRPFVDIKVCMLFKTNGLRGVPELMPKDKQELVKVLTEVCRLENEKTTILNAADATAFSLVTAIRTKDVKSIKLPDFIMDGN